MSGDTDKTCVIVGAGHAGTQCAFRLRRQGWRGRVVLLGAETRLPYHRPPLSKAVLQGTKSVDRIALFNAAAYEKARVEWQPGTRVVAVDRAQRELRTAEGSTVGYHALVLATGARVRTLDVPGANLDGVHYLRTLNDVARIRTRALAGESAVIVGGGYIGLETAASLRALGMHVTVLEAARRILQRVTCKPVSEFFHRVHAEAGVSLFSGVAVRQFVGDAAVRQVELSDGRKIAASLVVVGIGVAPDTALAAGAGLSVNDGICVSTSARTDDPCIYAIGDCASIEHAGYGRRVRLESVQNANDQALVAANTIAGSPSRYQSVPWFWSDQYDIKLQIAGLAEGADRVEVDSESADGRSMAVRYFAGSRLLAVDAINRPRDFVIGRKQIADDLDEAASKRQRRFFP